MSEDELPLVSTGSPRLRAAASPRSCGCPLRKLSPRCRLPRWLIPDLVVLPGRPVLIAAHRFSGKTLTAQALRAVDRRSEAGLGMTGDSFKALRVTHFDSSSRDGALRESAISVCALGVDIARADAGERAGVCGPPAGVA